MQQLCEAGEEEFLEIMALVGCFLLIYSYIHIFLIFIYSWYSRDHGAGGLFCAHILILNIFEIMALVGFLSFIHSQYYNLFPLIFYLFLNAIFRWGWPANLCMCGDYKRRCRNGFKIRVSFPFFSKSRWVFLSSSKSRWVFLSFRNLFSLHPFPCLCG